MVMFFSPCLKLKDPGPSVVPAAKLNPMAGLQVLTCKQIKHEAKHPLVESETVFQKAHVFVINSNIEIFKNTGM